MKVYLIGKTEMDKAVVETWLADLGVLPDDIDRCLDTDISTLAAKRCYLSFGRGLNPNITTVRTNWNDYCNNIIESGHGSVLEHISYTFALEGVSRVLTAELNRHRAGCAVSEGSMRYIRYDNGIPFVMPVLDGVVNAEEYEDITAEIEDALAYTQQTYNSLVSRFIHADMPFDKKKKLTSAFRRILPMGTATGGVWSFNLRALRHIISVRTSPQAEEEIAILFNLILKIVQETTPWLRLLDVRC